MNHGDTDDTEIVSGDQGDLPPIHDIAVEAHDDSDLEQVLEPNSEYGSPSEVVDEPVIAANENEIGEPQPPADIHNDWQSPVVEEPLVSVEIVSEAFEPEKVKLQPTGWQRVRDFFFGGPADMTARLNNLTRAIEDAPESAVNCVLRAELYTGLREYALAQADFQRAIELAETQFELADWGLLDQVMRDRALVGLDKVQRRLR